MHTFDALSERNRIIRLLTSPFALTGDVLEYCNARGIYLPHVEITSRLMLDDAADRIRRGDHHGRIVHRA